MNRYCLVLVISLIFSFLLIGCSDNSTQEIYGTPPPLPKVKWGMNEAEAMDALGLSDNDVKKTPSGFTVLNNGEVLGKPAILFLNFSEQYHTLVEIIAKLNPEDVEYVEEAINKERGEGKYSYNDKMEPIRAVWDDELLENNKERLSKVKDIYEKNGIKTSDDLLENGPIIGASPLTKWEMTLDQNSPLYGTIRFTGQFAAILNYPEKYNSN